MNYTYMGRTGLKVSQLCLGAMTFGRESSEADSFQILDRFVAEGGSFIDTANVYSIGLSETILGKWLKQQNRHDLVIATKVRFPMSEDRNDVGLSRKHIMASIDASLRRLGTDYVDLYQIHAWDPGTPLEETLSTLNNLVQSGKVRYTGASNVAAWQLQKGIDISRQMGWEPFSCLQPLYNLLDRSIEWEIMQVCRNEGAGIIPWSPLRGGWLSGKYRRGMEAPVAGTRIEEASSKGWSESWQIYNNPHTWSVVDELLQVAAEVEKTPAQVALNWLLQQPGVTAPIIGVRTIAHLEDNLGAVGWSLSENHVNRLNRAGAQRALPYPYNFIAGARGGRER